MLVICGRVFCRIRKCDSLNSCCYVPKSTSIRFVVIITNANHAGHSCRPMDVYSIVEFVRDRDVALVPTAWVSSSEEKEVTAFLPPYKDARKVRRSIRNRVAPNPDWPKHGCRVMATAGMFYSIH